MAPGLPYCVSCGSRAAGGTARDARRTVTVVISDLKGSTALGERLDAESLREVMGRYVDDQRGVLEAYGGRIEKIIGDAIVAVFGLAASADAHPRRAVEAADQARRSLVDLNDRIEDRWGVRLINRTGVATGEVVIGESSGGHRIITGAAMDTAERMEQRAPGLGVLLDPSTEALVRERVVAEEGSFRDKHGADPMIGHVLREVVDPLPPPGQGDEAEQACPECGEPTEEDWRWCGRCGADLGAVAASRESRRTLTIVFADARPAPGSQTDDADTLRSAMWSYFAVMRGILERHGATVEKFIGDAVMAVVGLRRRSEDDALRAVRAAWDMQAALPEVNARLQREHGLVLEQRIGVNTGNVVAGNAELGQRLVTGDAVNVAARLEQAAAPGEVLLGEQTLRLVRDAVEIEPLEPLALRGKSSFVRAFRLLKVAPEGSRARREDAPLVGRRAELMRLRVLSGGAARDGRARMATVLGDAGVGKTRLVEEAAAMAASDGAVVLHGRCLSYGEGITFWPVMEILREAAGIGGDEPVEVARSKLARVAGGIDADVADRLAALMGLVDAPYPLAELFWAVRRVLEALASRTPVLLQVDDVQWAEETFLDLLESLLESTVGPVTLLVTTRPELLERRPDWDRGERRVSIHLRPLTDGDVAQMVRALLGDTGPNHRLLARIVDAAAGNPLFVEQLTSMLIDTGRIVRRDGHWRPIGDLSDLAIPPTVEALLAARVDDLSPDERAVLEPAAVIGREFARDGVAALVTAEARTEVDLHLGGLAARQMVAAVPDEWPFDHRFHHAMIRDVAYDGLLKRDRADLHERFVAWAENAGLMRDHALEFEELLGFHLEQAHRCRAELGPLDDHGVELGRRAAALLGSAGRRSLVRGDMPTTAGLLRRAAALLPPGDRTAPRLLVQVAEAEAEMGGFAEADETLASAVDLAHRAAEEGVAAIARVERVRLAYLSGGGEEREVLAEAERALELFGRTGDRDGLARAWRLSASVELTRCQWGAATRAAEQLLENARAAGDDLMATRILPALAVFSLCGPTEAREGIARCDEILAEVAGDRRATALAERARAHLLAMRGDFDAARAGCRRARAALEELGWLFDAALVSLDSGPIEMLAGDPAAAEAELRRDVEALEAMGERNYVSTTAALLAEALYRRNRLDEAVGYAEFSREIAADDDVSSQVVWRSVMGKVLARRGEASEGEAVCREALAMIEVTDDLSMHADACVSLAEVLRLAGRPEDERERLRQAIALYRRKGNVVAARRAARRAAGL